MSWTLYRWVWKVRSPLHVGYTPAGALNRTRLYIPARNMWAALTAEIARRQASKFPDYKGLGQTLQQHARFTYLYPAERVNGRWHAWLPRYVQEGERAGLYWQREDDTMLLLSDRALRRRLLHTQPSTAIAASTGAAEEGTLREVEYIASYWKSERGQKPSLLSPVAFVGCLLLAEVQNDAQWQSILRDLQDTQELFIGGETRYGFGRLALVPFSKQEAWEQVQNCFGEKVDLNDHEPAMIAPSHLLGHGLLSSKEAKGDREVIFQWDWQTPQASNQLYWRPGTRVEPQNSQSTFQFKIKENGLWVEEKPLSS